MSHFSQYIDYESIVDEWAYPEEMSFFEVHNRLDEITATWRRAAGDPSALQAVNRLAYPLLVAYLAGQADLDSEAVELCSDLVAAFAVRLAEMMGAADEEVGRLIRLATAAAEDAELIDMGAFLHLTRQ
ncbi:MAG: hypothetical protein AAGA90_00800 [Actinomycetota bacterium]